MGTANDGNGGTGESAERYAAGVGGYDDASTQIWTPRPLVGEEFKHWLDAAWRHSSWKDCIVENLSWDGTATQNIEKYQREVGIP